MQWQIENTKTGVVLGVYEGDTEEQALDALARDVGLNSIKDADEFEGGDNLRVTLLVND